MQELALNKPEGLEGLVKQVVEDFKYRVHDLFYAPNRKAFILVVDLNSFDVMSIATLNAFSEALEKKIPSIKFVALDFDLIRKSRGYPAFILNVSGWDKNA